MERKNLEDLEIYNMSMDIDDKIWDIVFIWDHLINYSSIECPTFMLSH